MPTPGDAQQQAGRAPHDEHGLARFAEIVASLEPLLKRLWEAHAAPRKAHKKIPNTPGVYLFTENGKPMYVGQSRNVRQRLGFHTRPGAPQEQASFAFLLAKAEAKVLRLHVPGTRKQVARHVDFEPLFKNAKKRVAAMDVRFIEVPEPDRRTIFEVYASLALGTGEFNSFETH